QIWPTWQIPNSVVTWALWPLRILNHWSWPIRTSADEVTVPPYYADTRTVRDDIARHYNNIASLDVAVGKILDQLQRDGLADNTIVIFTADHGDGLPRAKRWLYDSGLHVPLIIRWPGVTDPGTQNAQLISLIDLAPTILSMAKIRPPPWMDGKIFVGPHQDIDERPYIFAARDRIDQQPDTVRAVRDERFKYIRHFHPDRPYVLPSEFRDQMPSMRELIALNESGRTEGAQELWFRKERDREELFDTLSDPHEILNLAQDPDQASRMREMRAALDDWLSQEEDLGLLPEQTLRDRFFPNGQQPITSSPTIGFLGQRAVIESQTEGASIEFSLNGGPWRLYTEPIEFEPGSNVEARAQRYGWAPSEITEAHN
ncbi:sulfatase-like hydrolase/transferase, partial [Myxococcota bacterium]|nr:sulfatase-like hydrolase/transferase [Myxococcota bacterium]